MVDLILNINFELELNSSPKYPQVGKIIIAGEQGGFGIRLLSAAPVNKFTFGKNLVILRPFIAGKQGRLNVAIGAALWTSLKVECKASETLHNKMQAM